MFTNIKQIILSLPRTVLLFHHRLPSSPPASQPLRNVPRKQTVLDRAKKKNREFFILFSVDDPRRERWWFYKNTHFYCAYKQQQHLHIHTIQSRWKYKHKPEIFNVNNNDDQRKTAAPSLVFVISSLLLSSFPSFWLCVSRLITIHLIFIIDKQAAAAHNTLLSYNVTFTEKKLARRVCAGRYARTAVNGKNGYNVKDLRAHLLFWQSLFLASGKNIQNNA